MTCKKIFQLSRAVSTSIHGKNCCKAFLSRSIEGRGGFRGGDLVTCHPLFSDMTLQTQILVVESLFLTSVSKSIRKYLLSNNFDTCTPLALIPLFLFPNLATIFFQEKLSINESPITGT